VSSQAAVEISGSSDHRGKLTSQSASNHIVYESLIQVLDYNEQWIRETLLPKLYRPLTGPYYKDERNPPTIWLPNYRIPSNPEEVFVTCFMQAFLLFSWPTQQKHPLFDHVKEATKSFFTQMRTNERVDTVQSMAKLVLDLGTIQFYRKVHPNYMKVHPDYQSTVVQKCWISEAITDNILKDNQFSSVNSQNYILFSVKVKMHNDSPPSTAIPLTFPVTINGQQVVFQLLAAVYRSQFSNEEDRHIQFVSRYGSYHFGRYIKLNTVQERDFVLDKKQHHGIEYCLNRGSGYRLRELYFVPGNTTIQENCKESTTINDEIMCISNSLSVTGSDISKFVDGEEFVFDNIIQGYCSAVDKYFKNIEAKIQRLQWSNIILPVQFINLIKSILTDLHLSEVDKKSQVTDYVIKNLGNISFTDSTILHVLVNLDNEHWNYFTVVFSSFTIYVCDSLTERSARYEDTRKAALEVLQTFCNWEYERHNTGTILQVWERKECTVLQQNETKPTSCGVYCMVFLMRGYLEGLFSATPFESFNLLEHAKGNSTLKINNKKFLLKELKSTIADVILEKTSILSIMSFFAVEETRLYDMYEHKNNFPCEKKWLLDESYELVNLRFCKS